MLSLISNHIARRTTQNVVGGTVTDVRDTGNDFDPLMDISVISFNLHELECRFYKNYYVYKSRFYTRPVM